MIDSSGVIGSAGQGGSVSNIRDPFSRDTRPSRGVASGSGGSQGATPNGPRGRRMLSPNTPVESLDQRAPRGTYLDILA